MAALVLGCGAVNAAGGAELADAQKLYNQGKYAECVDACGKAIDAGGGGGGGELSEGWWLLKIKCELAIGRYADAQKTFETGVDRFDTSVEMRLLGYQVLLMNDKPADAEAILSSIRVIADLMPGRYTDTPSRVALGGALLKSGSDARQVLEQYFDKAKKDDPEAAAPYVASGELALQKEDYGLAAESFKEAAKRAPEDPDVYLGLARAYVDDAEQTTAALHKALELNPNHVASLLYEADNLLDREAYTQAETVLKKALEVNARDPRAWSYRAVLANLTGDHKQEAEYRDKALADWKSNPEVDWQIGLKLAHEYRFAEGEAHQRRALEFLPTYLPAKEQLCQDLLRLAKEEEGWKLADEVFKEDPYNVQMYNLVTLHDVIKKFRTVENDHFQLLMDPHEADIYGQRALALVTEAREKFSAKYQVSLPDKTVIEIFPAQKDFAVRTFGLPGGEGFLGVCFGPVVTVNSPQSRAANPSNWEAILWHEFCHSITLYKTHNKMPRWLSEGISVYEEGQRNPSWAEHMNPDYRELVAKGEATPVSKLSSAFMAPPTPMHLMFAYYESSQVVSFVIQKWGADALNGVLTDLGADVSINEALAKHTEPIEKLDADFATYLKAQADALAPGANWDEPKLPPDADSAAFAVWNVAHPNNFWGLLGEARALLVERKWEAAKEPLNQAIDLNPTYYEGGGAYGMLAAAHRELNERGQERAILEKYVKLDPDAVNARLRLMALAAEDKDWKLVRTLSEEVLGINPLIAPPYQFLARSSEALDERSMAIEAHRTLLKLDPLDKAEQHYQVGRLLAAEKNLPEARREVLLALEEAPRYRAALDLLLDIAGKMDAATQPALEGATSRPVDPPATAPGEAAPAAPTSSRDLGNVEGNSKERQP